MIKGFWEKLQRQKQAKGEPIFALAPLANVTDAAFRRLLAKYSKYGGQDIFDDRGKFTRLEAKASGGPDVMFTEFVSADGLFLGGEKALLRDLEYSEAERPIVAQFFTSRPDMMEKAAKLAVELGFDGIDINMGCPDRSIERQGSGAAHIKNPKLAREIIRAAQKGAGDIPVSVKTRVGYNKNQLDEWLPELIAEKPAVVTVHARTRKEMSKVPARWHDVAEAVKIRDSLKSETLIIGNGDVVDTDDGRRKCMDSRADGVMLGRAIFGRPYLFSNSHELENREDPEVIKKILLIMLEHTKLFEELLGDIKNFAIMKKHYKAYVTGFDGAKELRMRLMESTNAQEVEEIVLKYLKRLKIKVFQ